MESIKELLTAVRAGQVFGYCKTTEHERTIDFVKNEINSFTSKSGQNPYKAMVWGIGNRGPNDEDIDPPALINMIDKSDPGTVWILKNFNWLLDACNPLGNFAYDIVQVFQDKMIQWRSGANRKFILIVTSTPIETGLPKELVDYFFPFEFERPNIDEVRTIFDRMYQAASEKADKMPEMDDKEINRVIEAGRGMTSIEIEDGIAKSLIKDKGIKAESLHKEKSKMLDKVAAIEYDQCDITYDQIIGLHNLKDRITKTAPHPLAKGILVVGPPGCGKTMLARATGNELGRPVLLVELANTFGSLVGESYERMTAIIDVIKAMAPCVVVFDEIEKGMAGVGSGDSGGTTGNEITKRTMSLLLKFMSEPHPGVYIFATCNSIDAFKTSPEYLRAGRWDTAPFYLGLPNDEEKKAILEHYKKQFDVKGDPGDMDGWSGAEIESCCRQSAMTGESLKISSEYIKPIGKIVGEAELNRLADWAEKNAISAGKKLKMKKENIVQNGERALDLDI